ncbi:sigma-70 family RNA polymerase sigma factor [Aquisalimonas asiatica]|uniref:RNA polymerase sigma-70 factor, ECF subfamily n=1 Tax=Aquisalimonas asiatica TaxID=406100 RepID=A0A1H8SY00_9GAMM|nr:sigma-70 family RNA polymerase sigma factor [Aquisalimonas asiatica]SEO83517.1 RNA polymerase sigma-70 factor, ECF subfamily [Aquisalimonas asiatica]
MRAASPGTGQPVSSIYLEHHSWLLNWLRLRLGCADTAADLAQDAFLRLLQRQHQGDHARRPRAYLTTIAHGLVVNHWRRRDIERAYQEALAQRPEPVTPSPEEHHLILEALYEIEAMFRTLPGRVRRAFLLSVLDGLTYREIGNELGVSERMVKKYMAQAMLQCLTFRD